MDSFSWITSWLCCQALEETAEEGAGKRTHAEKQDVESPSLGAKHRNGRWHSRNSVVVVGVQDADPKGKWQEHKKCVGG